MRFWLLILSLSVLTKSLAAESGAGEEPFWKAKPEVYKKVVDERRIFVSVTDRSDESRKVMKLNGGGQVSAPKSFTFQELQDFEKLFKDNGYIKKIQVDQAHKFLFIQAEAYGLSSAMKIRWKVKQNEEKLSVISFQIVAGLMEGFKWDLRVEPAKNRKTDVGIIGRYEYEKFPLPAFFLKFGLEVIFQRLAIDIRSSVEQSFKNETRK